LNIVYTTQFKRDYKRIKKQKKNLLKLRSVIETLASGQNMAQRHKDHQLSGRCAGLFKSKIKYSLQPIYHNIKELAWTDPR